MFRSYSAVYIFLHQLVRTIKLFSECFSPLIPWNEKYLKEYQNHQEGGQMTSYEKCPVEIFSNLCYTVSSQDLQNASEDVVAAPQGGQA